MFLLMSVILLTGEGCYPSMHCRWYPSMPCSRSPGGHYPSMHCRWYPSMPCSRSPGRGCYLSMHCSRSPGECLVWGHAWSRGICSGGGGVVWPSIMVFCYGLLVWPSGMAFWFGGLLIEDGLLVESGLLLWPSGVWNIFLTKMVHGHADLHYLVK